MDPRLKFDALDEWLQVIYNEDQIKIEEIKNHHPRQTSHLFIKAI